MELFNPLLLCFCFMVPLCSSDLSSHFVLEPYDLLFDSAVEAYYKGNWLSVILNMEKALRNKATVRRVKTQCRLSCANQTTFGEQLAGGGDPVPGSGSLADLGFFQNILKRAHCVRTCESEKLGSPTFHEVTEDVELEFRKRTPYNYLQVAYFKINQLDKAVAAAHTFFQANPDHMEMKQNLDYYKMMAGVEEEHFKDLEAREHMAQFLLGKRFYSDDVFERAAEHFERALSEYFSANQECRVLCEGAYNYDGYTYMEYSADLFQTITDHYMQVLSCKQRCALELASHTEQPFDNFLPSHFNYLQFSYYNRENYEQAIECAKTFLLFHPDDEVMKDNLAYYSAILGEDKAQTISPRQVAKEYIHQSILEKELLYFGYEAFGITFVDPDKWTPEDIMPKKLRDKQKADRETAARITEEIGNLMKEIETLVEEKKKDSSDMAKMITPAESAPQPHGELKVSLTEEQLNGSRRVLLDQVISAEECRQLQRLSNAAALKGDGYSGKPSPHSPGEMFQGVTVLKALKLGQEGKVPLKGPRVLFDVSEKVRKILELHFHLETPLYFSYTHLVCRSAIDEKQEDRADLSHPVHADNCLLVSETNECIKEPPAYTHRDYSAILYLNEDFEGGNFIFTQLDAKTVTAEVRPRCGRMVGFAAGKENPHGVRAVTRGQRCAVALWFTLDPAHEEKERIQAQEVLKMLAAPVNQEFFGNAEPGDSEAPAQAQQAKTDEKQEEKAEKKQLEAAAADVQDEKLPKMKPASKAETASQTKAANAANAAKAAKAAKAANAANAAKAAKATNAANAKSPAKDKAKTKKTDKKSSKSAAKKTDKGATKTSKAGGAAASGSQDGRDEL